VLRLRWARAGLIPLIAAAALLAPVASAAAQDPTTLVMVETADICATPDTAAVGADIRRADTTAARARRRVERALSVKLRRLAALGVPRTDIRTESIQSSRTRRHGRTVHRAATSLRIRTTDLAKLPAILRALGGADLDGLEFSLSDDTAARQDSTRLALERARRRADAAAATLGLRVVAIRKVDLNPEWAIDTSGSEPASGDARGGGDSGSPAPIRVEPGQEEVTVSVAVIFALAP